MVHGSWDVADVRPFTADRPVASCALDTDLRGMDLLTSARLVIYRNILDESPAGPSRESWLAWWELAYERVLARECAITTKGLGGSDSRREPGPQGVLTIPA